MCDTWVRKIPKEGNGNPFQYSCLENSMNRAAWQATVPWVTKSQIQLESGILTSGTPGKSPNSLFKDMENGAQKGEETGSESVAWLRWDLGPSPPTQGSFHHPCALLPQPRDG